MKFSLLCLVAAFAGASAQVEFSRTISDVSVGSGTVTITPAGACTGSDAYGSNDCTLTWGTKYTFAINASLNKAIDTGATVDVDLTVDGLIPFKASCPLCGANCTVKIPVVGKTFSFAMPACPIAIGAFNKALSAALPAKSPIPVKTSIKGTVTAKDASGATLANVAVTASLAPPSAAVEAVEAVEAADASVTLCGCTCDCSGLLCSEASKGASLCALAAQHGITNGEACSKAGPQINTLAHGLVTLSSCSGTFSDKTAAKVHKVSAAFLAAKAPAASTHYGNPTAGCMSGEEAVQIQGVTGDFCSPSCASAACPTDVPTGTTAMPECALETQGSSKPSRCALICQSASKCPANASCKMVQGTIGLCTYDK